MKTKRAYLLDAAGGITPLPQLEGKECKLADMYPIIGCDTIEHVGLGKGVDLWCDENGLMYDKVEINPIATKLYRAAYPALDPRELVIVGACIVTDNSKAGVVAGQLEAIAV